MLIRILRVVNRELKQHSRTVYSRQMTQHVIEQMFEEEFGPPSSAFVAADIDGEDAQLLRQQAAAEGLEPHVYAARLIHNALHPSKAA